MSRRAFFLAAGQTDPVEICGVTLAAGRNTSWCTLPKGHAGNHRDRSRFRTPTAALEPEASAARFGALRPSRKARKRAPL